MSCEEIRDRIALSAARGAAPDEDVRDHLAGCGACRDEEPELRRAAVVLRAALALPEGRGRRAPLFAPRRRIAWLRLAPLAAVAAALLLLVQLLPDGAPPISLVPSGDVTPAVAPTSVPKAPPAAGARAAEERAPAPEASATGKPAPLATAPPPASPPSAAPPPAAPPTAEAKQDERPVGSCTGTLVYDDGTPVADEPVWLWGSPHVTARTDARGAFRIEGDWVSPMARSLMLGPDDAATIVGQVELRKDQTVEVEAKPFRGVELTVEVVREDTGAPIPKFWVALRSERERDHGSAFGTTGADGRVRFRHVMREPYLLDLDRKGWRARSETIDLARIGPVHRARLRPADRLTFRFVGGPRRMGGSISVRMGDVRQPTRHLQRFGELAPDGTFVTDTPLPGSWCATVESEVWNGKVAPFEVPEQGPVEVPIHVARHARVQGDLRDAAGAPIAAVYIQFQGIEGSGFSHPLPSVRGHPDKEGRFQVDLVPGRYQVLVQAGDQFAYPDPGEVEVPPSGVPHLPIRLEGGSVSGNVVGCPAPDKHLIQLRRWDGTKWVHRGAVEPHDDGRFRAHWLTPGRWQLHQIRSRSRAGDGWADPVEVDVAPGAETTGVGIRWRACPEIDLVLRTGTGAPAKGAVRIVAFLADAQPGVCVDFEIELDRQGRAATKAFPPGRWNVQAGNGPQVLSEVREGSNPPIELIGGK
jgi:hypothetical protein